MRGAGTDPRGRVSIAAEVLGERAEHDVPIGPMTTYRVGGAASLLVRARDTADLVAVRDAHLRSGLPVLIVGRGSNLLVADRGFEGIAVIAADLAERLDIDLSTSRVVAGGSIFLPVLARRTAAAGLTGFEWAVGVPGSVGGAVRMNAGGHGSDIAACLRQVTIADLGSPGEVIGVTPAEDLELRFRGSALTSTQLVLDATLQLAPGDRDRSEREISEIVAWRRANQPGGQNAGSVFVNPVPGEVSAGELIDSLGLRGLRVGSAEVSPKHANFIQADDGGSADDVRQLIEMVRERVLDATGYALRSEIRLVGYEERP